MCESRHSIVVAELPRAAWLWAQSHSEGPQTNGSYVDWQISNLYLKCNALATDYIVFSRRSSKICIFYSLFDAQSKKKCQPHNILENCVRSLSCLFYYTSGKKIFTPKKKKELAKICVGKESKEHENCQSQIQLYSSTHDWRTLIKNIWVTKGQDKCNQRNLNLETLGKQQQQQQHVLKDWLIFFNILLSFAHIYLKSCRTMRQFLGSCCLCGSELSINSKTCKSRSQCATRRD